MKQAILFLQISDFSVDVSISKSTRSPISSRFINYQIALAKKLQA